MTAVALAILLVVISILIFCSALFSGVETALFSLKPHQLRRLETNHPRLTKFVQLFRENPRHVLNVLLLGDSITRNYFPQVTHDLRGVANVYLMASSTSVGDPRLSDQIAEFAATQRVSFAVIHFNNGMHGWGYTEAQFQSGFPMFLRAIRSLPGRGKLIWATITPVKPEASGGATNPRIDARNAVAHAFIEAEKILIDDQHGLMSRHLDLYEDAVHFNETGSAIMGGQAATIIKRALETPGREQHGQD